LSIEETVILASWRAGGRPYVELHIRPIKSHRFVCPESQQSAEHQPFVGAVFGLSQWQFVAGRGRPVGLGDTWKQTLTPPSGQMAHARFDDGDEVRTRSLLYPLAR